MLLGGNGGGGVLADPKGLPGRSGIYGALSQLFGGQNNPGLSPEQNAHAAKQARLQAGLQMIMASRGGMTAPGTLQLLAGGALTGQQAGQGARQQMAMGQAMQNPALGLSPRQQAMLAALPPEAQQQVLAQLATQAPPGLHNVPDGAAVLGPDGRPIFMNPKDPAELGADARFAMQRLGIADLATATPEQLAALDAYLKGMNEARAPKIDLGTREDQKVSDVAMAQYSKAVEDMQAMDDMLGRLDMMDQLLAAGLQTNQLESLTMPLRGLAAAVGLADADKLGRQQVFQGLANRIALLMRGSSMPGPMSDKDIQFLVNQAPKLANTVEGNRLLIETLRRVAEAQRAYTLELDRYLDENGSSRGWLPHMTKWKRENRIDISDLVAPAAAALATPAQGSVGF